MRLRASWGWTLLLACVCGVGGRLGSAFPSPKTWWTKQITRQVYAAGRLTGRQIKYAADAGFRTLVSLYQFEGRLRHNVARRTTYVRRLGGGGIRRMRTLGHVRGYKGDACSRILLKGLDFGDVPRTADFGSHRQLGCSWWSQR